MQGVYLPGRKEEAAGGMRRQLFVNTNPIGPGSYVAERIAAHQGAGVADLAVNPIGADAVKTIETLRTLIG